MTDKLAHEPKRKLLVKVEGMHCANCEVLIERRFKTIAGVRKVRARYGDGKVELHHTGELDIATLQRAIADDDYTVSAWQKQHNDSQPATGNGARDYIEIGAVLLILVALYAALKQFDVVPDRLQIPSTISYGLAFAIGVVASVSTCIAVTGGLLVAIAARYNAASAHMTTAQRFRPHLYFNAGRLISYTFFGAVIGAIGSTLSFSAEANGILVVVASAIMILLGLQMLKLLPGGFLPRTPKFIAHKIHSLTEREAKGGAFFLGASTFFLPCGFTQALQLYVLAKGSVETGALVMLAFALGTLPALLSLSALSNFAAGTFQRYFLKFAGVAVVMLGFFNIQNGLTLTAIATTTPEPAPPSASQASLPPAQTVPIVDGKQIVDMKIVGYRYQPHIFAVRQGIPVEWRIDAQQAAGCGRILIAPKAGVRKLLPFGVTTISFTPQQPGDIGFNCSMGMMTRGSKITVLAAQEQPAPKISSAETPASQAQPLSAEQRANIERITKDYLLQHPEVLQEAFAELGRRQQADEEALHRAAVKENAGAIFSPQRQVVLGNPNGDVTLVEFFDYNCAYCKHALADTIALLQSDPKLRIILREFPVLGEASLQAAKVAVAVRMQDDTGQKYLQFHQKLLGSRGPADLGRALSAAKDAGLDMTRLERDMASAEVKTTLGENQKLAESIGLSGTPSYVVGSDIVVGAVGVEALRGKIAAARSEAKD